MKHTFFILLCMSLTLFCRGQESVNFTLFTDIHYDIIDNADQRLENIFEGAEKNSSQFIIQLGDFAILRSSNQRFVDAWLKHPIEKYSVLGNHDLDIGTKKQYLDFMAMKAPFYFFDKGICRFIVLDTNFMVGADGELRDYADSNYYGAKQDRISSEQLNWLSDLLKKDTSKHIVLFTHAPVDGAVDDNESFVRLRKILTTAQSEGVKIVGVFSGHNHLDCHTVVDNIHYMQINSASYMAVGEDYADRSRYPESVYESRSYLPNTVPYQKALYADIRIDASSRRVEVRGVKGDFIAPSPQKLGVPMAKNKITGEDIEHSASVTDVSYKY